MECGIFGASMIVRSAAEGPVNVIVDMPPETKASAARTMEVRDEK